MPPVDTPADPPALAACAAALGRYGEPLLRAVAAHWLRPRTHWSADEIRDRLLAALADPVAVDRALKSVSPAARRLLNLVAVSRQPRWRVTALADLQAAIDPAAEASAIQELLSAGFLYPELSGKGSITNLTTWLQQASVQSPAVTAVPLALARVRAEDFGLPTLPHDSLGAAAPQESDGFEWLLRLAAVWQFVREGPLRRTQQGGLFKRDLDRLRAHPVLSAPPAVQLQAVPDPELLAIALARAAGVLTFEPDQIRAAQLPGEWSDGLGPALLALWSAWGAVEGWDPTAGATDGSSPKSTAAGATLALAALGKVPEGAWVRAADVEQRLASAPGLGGRGTSAFLLGVGHQLRLVEAARHGDNVWVRLGPVGRAAVKGAKTVALERPGFEQTLLVQPNLEVVLYRQGLTPALMARLTQFAEWRTLGLACTLRLTADSVYRGLEAGETLADVVALLERHGTRELAPAVLSNLRSWASKRERVLVFPSALILEFRSETDLDRAQRLGLVEYKLSDRLGLVTSDGRMDYGKFRLVGSRDYLSPDEHCVEVNGDGLTITVNEFKADLLLESEIRRFAEPVPAAALEERSRFRMTPASLVAARRQGLDLKALNAWFLRRSGGPLTPTAKMLLAGDELPPSRLEQMTVLRVPTEELADGIESWAETRGLVRERLGPTLLAVPAAAVLALQAKLAEVGVRIEDGAR
jgi:hypothetical protein